MKILKTPKQEIKPMTRNQLYWNYAGNYRMTLTQKSNRTLLGNSTMLRLMIILMGILLGGILNAQNTRFVYQYQHLHDSLNPASVIAEIGYLDINEPQKSVYYDYDTYRKDSILQSKVKLSSGERLISGNFTPYVEKNSSDIVYYTSLGSDSYKVADKRPMDWKILPDREKIGTYDCQKAVLDFGGRKWTAWFTDEIPIPDGPYKFHGLPGLIVKIEDQSNSHKFELIQVTQGTTPVLGGGRNFIPVSQERYEKAYLSLVNDPNQQLNRLGKINQIVVNGEKVDTQAFLRSGALGFKPEINPIEIIEP